MFNEIEIKAIPVLAKVLMSDTVTEDGRTIPALETKEEVLEEMELIDNMLVVMKSKSLLNKKHGLRRILSGMIEMHIAENSIVSGSSNLQLKGV